MNWILNESNISLSFRLKHASSIAQPSDCLRVGKEHIIRAYIYDDAITIRLYKGLQA